MSQVSWRSSLPGSEFPSLSGNAQTHYQNPGQAIWANANQRAVQHTPVQRPQQQHPTSVQASTQQQQQQGLQGQEHSPLGTDTLFSTRLQFSSTLDDYRHGGQVGVGQLSGTSQPQTGNIEEFPPLGRNGNDESSQDRRGSLMQSAAFGSFSSSNNFNLPHNNVHNRQGLSTTASTQIDRGSATLADRIMSPSTMGLGGAVPLLCNLRQDAVLMCHSVAISSVASWVDKAQSRSTWGPGQEREWCRSKAWVGYLILLIGRASR